MSSKTKGDAEHRFIAFAKTLLGAEYIDQMDLSLEQTKARKADFLFDNRRIICELKSLKTDTGGKVEEILSPHRARPEWPIFFGSVEVQKILKYLPDRDRINRQLFDAVTTAIKDLTRSANSQIRQTKDTFELPSAGGMLVILNEFIDILSPDVIAHKIDELFRKKTPDGESWFPHINAVWIINESHYQEVAPDLEAIPALIMTNNLVPDLVNVASFIDSLQPKWAHFNGAPLIRMEGGYLDNINFQSMKKKRQKTAETIPRHEMWRRQYRRRPYLRALSKQELMEYFERLLTAMGPGFLKGATEKQRSLMTELMEPWTHFLEEVNLLGLDMREFSPVTKGLGPKIQETVGVDVSEEESRVVIKQTTQGPVFVEHHTRGAIAKINFYALSLAASRIVDGVGHVDHAASYAPAPINTIEAASEYGFKEAEERWPTGDGWSHRVDVKVVELKFEFGNKST